MQKKSLLYSYRRCPYAIRARMVLIAAEINCDVCEIDFKNKPIEMLALSPKGTVPVLQSLDGQVLDESLDILHWALEQYDPQKFLVCDHVVAESLISENDGAFKMALDQYKYPDRFPDTDCSDAQHKGLSYLEVLNNKIEKNGQLLGEQISYADLAIFPFVRQFANVDRNWFDKTPLKPLQNWLSGHLESDLFQKAFQKQREERYSLL